MARLKNIRKKFMQASPSLTFFDLLDLSRLIPISSDTTIEPMKAKKTTPRDENAD